MSSHQQVVIIFAVVLFVAVVIPRLFGGGGSGGVRDTYRQPRSPGGPERGHPLNLNSGNNKGKVVKNVHQAKVAVEQEIRNERAKNSKGLAFTLMPLYAIGVAVFAAYKFVKIKFQNDKRIEQEKSAKEAKEKQVTENQLSELEQRLAQTEKMLNSLLTQLDPLTKCVNTLASDQRSEIMTQLQSIKHLMKESGIDTPPGATQGKNVSCGKKLDSLIQSLAEEPEETTENAAHTDDEYSGGDDHLESSCAQGNEIHEYGDEYTEGEPLLINATDTMKGKAVVEVSTDHLDNWEQAALRRRHKYD
ncbi:coiled-coil domain-containing protein 107 [Protopterus annectens]|uniref:coiled-coil domain-containing protein 107 n=1 Tax=Protopterus annectens TaxID=7888 RepID=UPI001CF99147|nr:coiled-coil domain-containing protein 107 [Protopterus annectens]